ncbi:MAG: hypothetical protein MUF69_12145 [Desulfobacterota bacterium]|nr:hypothetical protein [Thermodesulfobacteriota bacterium]
MKFKGTAVALLGFVLFLFAGWPPLQAATPLEQLGHAPFYRAKSLKAHDVYPLLVRFKKDVALGFAQAGAADLYEPFMEQLKKQKPEAVSVQPGQNLQWMMYKKKGQVRVTRDRVWAGRAPFEAYRTVVRYQDVDYDFIVPKICLNIALKEVTAVPRPAAPPAAKEPPATTPAPPAQEPGKPPVTTAPPPPAKEPPATTPAPPAQEPGKPPVTTAPPPPAKETEPKVSARKGFFVGDVGMLGRFDVSAFGLLRVGYRYKFQEKFAVTGLVGAAPLLDGDNDESAFLADAILTYYPVSNFFMGAGVGLWAGSSNSKADLILEIGIPINQAPESLNFELFMEGRSAFDQMGDWTKYGRWGGGLRILF